jgi:hypothetical protein
MGFFVVGYYALLIGASCIAAYMNKREAFLLLFSLTLVSFIVGIVGGQDALWWSSSSRSSTPARFRLARAVGRETSW